MSDQATLLDAWINPNGNFDLGRYALALSVQKCRETIQEDKRKLNSAVERSAKNVLSKLSKGRFSLGDTKLQAYRHPEHNNEALFRHEDCWMILDSCGDICTFETLEEALKEFLCPIGHQMWFESLVYNQAKPPIKFIDEGGKGFA